MIYQYPHLEQVGLQTTGVNFDGIDTTLIGGV